MQYFKLLLVWCVAVVIPLMGLRFAHNEDTLFVYGPAPLVRKFALQFQNNLWPGWQRQASHETAVKLRQSIDSAESGQAFYVGDDINHRAMIFALKTVQHQP